MVATKPKDRIGSLVVNPGGPGGSGVDYARAADFIVGKPVRQQFDVVGFDPRGVQRSQPIDCLPDAQMDAFLGQDPTPDDPAEAQQFAVAGKEFALGCQQRTGALISHVSTVDAAKDMDILRSALGDEKLNYLGKSYGTLLGATYAELLPRAGRPVRPGRRAAARHHLGTRSQEARPRGSNGPRARMRPVAWTTATARSAARSTR